MLPALYTLSSLRFLLARNARADTSARSIDFCAIWVCKSVLVQVQVASFEIRKLNAKKNSKLCLFSRRHQEKSTNSLIRKPTSRGPSVYRDVGLRMMRSGEFQGK